jgi:hypothetical protein
MKEFDKITLMEEVCGAEFILLPDVQSCCDCERDVLALIRSCSYFARLCKDFLSAYWLDNNNKI